jgi:DNA-binding NarL/FixJ family response regulator
MASILIIETKDMVRALYREALNGQDIWSMNRRKGLTGIRSLDEWSMDLVITDIRVPDCDGVELIASVRHKFPTVKIVAVSAQAGHEDALRTATLLGADATLRDALDGEALLDVVDRLLGGR